MQEVPGVVNSPDFISDVCEVSTFEHAGAKVLRQELGAGRRARMVVTQPCEQITPKE